MKVPSAFNDCEVQFDLASSQYKIKLRDGAALAIPSRFASNPDPDNRHQQILSHVINSALGNNGTFKGEAVTTIPMPTDSELYKIVEENAREILEKFDRPISTSYFQLLLQSKLKLPETPQVRTQLHKAVSKSRIKRHAYDNRTGYYWSVNSPNDTPPAKMPKGLREQNRRAFGGAQNEDGDDLDDERDDERDDENEQQPQQSQPPANTSDLEKRVTRLEKGVVGIVTAVGSLTKAVEDLKKVQKVEITLIADKKKVTIKDHTHEIFEECIFHLSVGDFVMLVGPKGCGKTTLCGQLAKALKRQWNFMSMSGGVTETKLYGKSTPNITNGKMEYHAPVFVQFYENGGLYLIDEVDAGDPNVLLSLNNPLENKQMAVERTKNPLINMHKNFICMSAANTWGHGADRQYVGRNQLDGAFVERWVQLDMDYDKKLEFAICPGRKDFVTKMHEYRDRVRLHKMEREISTRWIARMYRWQQHGKDDDYCIEKLFKGWRADEIRKVKGL